jgi:hypothetical protein
MDVNMSPFISASALQKLLIYIFVSSLLVACGGSGGGGGKEDPDQPIPVKEDITPDTFSFTPLIDVARDVQLVSEAVTILGINTKIEISILGGEYSIDGG